MKLNERVFEVLNGEPVEVQNLDGHEVKIYILDDYPDVLNEFVNKGKFAVWSCVDGTNYKLAIEKGYYDELRELYSDKVNDTWLKFWDECEKISSTFSKKIVLPATAVIIVIFVVLMALSNKMPGKLGTYLTLGLAIFYVLVILILRKLTTNKINIANQNALAVIKKNLGEAHFNDLLERQRNYIDAYYDTLSAKEEAEASANEENVNELKETEETTEAEKEESNNNEETEVKEKEVVETTEEASNETSKNK
ncbi:MAG TPA: hypothetical protein DIU44_02925 [Acholeplasmatales bacterium]|nr:hypothetical membrane-bound protein [Clostridium sp. CAG:307]HCS24856.1 hypothetical protein [Acholeplasmatales bacterium]